MIVIVIMILIEELIGKIQILAESGNLTGIIARKIEVRLAIQVDRIAIKILVRIIQIVVQEKTREIAIVEIKDFKNTISLLNVETSKITILNETELVLKLNVSWIWNWNKKFGMGMTIIPQKTTTKENWTTMR